MQIFNASFAFGSSSNRLDLTLDIALLCIYVLLGYLMVSVGLVVEVTITWMLRNNADLDAALRGSIYASSMLLACSRSPYS